jgi:hypothetical protein
MQPRGAPKGFPASTAELVRRAVEFDNDLRRRKLAEPLEEFG